jgi:hypothetical protein
MDSYEGAATLEWWASRSTCLGSLRVRVAARAAGDIWTCEAILEPHLAAEDRESFHVLMQLDPHFTLRLTTRARCWSRSSKRELRDGSSSPQLRQTLRSQPEPGTFRTRGLRASRGAALRVIARGAFTHVP